MGPIVRAGKKVRAPTRRITPISSDTKIKLEIGNEAKVEGCTFFSTKEPAKASTGMITKNRPRSIAMLSVILYQEASGLSPANALPLLAAAELKA